MKDYLVITPTYKRDELLKQTISSVIAQNYLSYDHLIIDDNDSEQTRQTVESFSNESIIYIPRKRSKIDKKTCSNAINFGINHILSNDKSYKYIKVLHDDDFLYKDSLSRHKKYFEDNRSIGLVYGKEIRLDEQKNNYEVKGRNYFSNPKIIKTIVLAKYIQYTTLTYLWEQFLEIYDNEIGGWYDPSLSFGEDKDVTCRYLALINQKKLVCYFDSEICSIYRKAGADRITNNIQETDKNSQITKVIKRNSNSTEKIVIYLFKFLFRPTRIIPNNFRKRLRFLLNIEEKLYHKRKPLNNDFIYWFY